MACQALGVDACGEHGWVAVLLTDGRFTRALVAKGLQELCSRVPVAEVIAVDMPLGLLEDGWRRADQEGRRLLGRRGSTLFPIAPRPVWQEPTYEAASARCLELTGNKLQRQPWGLAPKLLEANEVWRGHSSRMFEVHPELSFAALNAGTALLQPKKSWNGQQCRRALLESAGVVLPQNLDEAGIVPVDDVLDAAAAAWSAHRIALGTASRVPAELEADSDGRSIAIWY